MSAKGAKRNQVEPENVEEVECEADPPSSCADNCIFMPVLVSTRIKEHFRDQKNTIRSFTSSNRRSRSLKVNPTAFVAHVVVSPDHFKLPFENIRFPSKDGTVLNGYLVPLMMSQGRHVVPTVILCHGNSGNIGDNLPWVAAMHDEISCNIFIFDYRGYGFSEGKPSERGVYLDVQAAFDFVYDRKDLNSKYIVLHGQSIGGAIALDLAVRKDYKDRLAGLIIENTFSSLHSLLHEYSKHCCLRPTRLLFKCMQISKKFRNAKKIPHVQCPLLIISSLKDQIIPPSHSTFLFMRSPAKRKRLYRDSEGEHMNAYLKDSYYVEIAEFLVEVISAGSAEGSTVSALGVRKSRPNSSSNSQSKKKIAK